MLSNTQFFALDARIELTNEEKDLIRKYNLNKELLYTSEEAKQHAASVLSTPSVPGLRDLAKMAVSRARLSLSLKCTVDSLVKGQHIECKDVAELIAAEAAIVEAAQTLKTYLQAALSFDGREELVEV
jgi:hypothetical protein